MRSSFCRIPTFVVVSTERTFQEFQVGWKHNQSHKSSALSPSILELQVAKNLDSQAVILSNNITIDQFLKKLGHTHHTKVVDDDTFSYGSHLNCCAGDDQCYLLVTSQMIAQKLVHIFHTHSRYNKVEAYNSCLATFRN